MVLGAQCTAGCTGCTRAADLKHTCIVLRSNTNVHQAFHCCHGIVLLTVAPISLIPLVLVCCCQETHYYVEQDRQIVNTNPLQKTLAQHKGGLVTGETGVGGCFDQQLLGRFDSTERGHLVRNHFCHWQGQARYSLPFPQDKKTKWWMKKWRSCTCPAGEDTRWGVKEETRRGRPRW